MIAVLDTNLLYYIYDDSNSELSSNKVLAYLKNNFENFYISEYSIMEMYTKYRNDFDSIISIINFLYKNNIPVIPTLNKPYNIVSNEIFEQMHDYNYFCNLINYAFQQKKNIEASYLCFLTTSISSIVIACKCFINNETIKSSTYAGNLFHFFQINAVKNSPLENDFRIILDKFYADGKESDFKDSVMNCIDLFCEVLLTFTEIEKKGDDFSKYNVDKDEEKINNIIAENYNKLKSIEKRFSGDKKIFNDIEMSNLDMILSRFEQSLVNSNIMPIGRIKYIKNFLLSFFKHKGQKLSKNDIFDSLFLTHYPNQQLLTADTRFQNRIKEFDIEYYNNIIRFIDSCKK